jgi:serine/threonine protein kinase
MAQVLKLNISHHIMREKEILASLKQHPNVIELLATAKDDENLYFIFEVSPNGTLHQLVTERGK